MYKISYKKTLEMYAQPLVALVKHKTSNYFMHAHMGDFPKFGQKYLFL